MLNCFTTGDMLEELFCPSGLIWPIFELPSFADSSLHQSWSCCLLEAYCTEGHHFLSTFCRLEGIKNQTIFHIFIFLKKNFKIAYPVIIKFLPCYPQHQLHIKLILLKKTLGPHGIEDNIKLVMLWLTKWKRLQCIQFPTLICVFGGEP